MPELLAAFVAANKQPHPIIMMAMNNCLELRKVMDAKEYEHNKGLTTFQEAITALVAVRGAAGCGCRPCSATAAAQHALGSNPQLRSACLHFMGEPTGRSTTHYHLTGACRPICLAFAPMPCLHSPSSCLHDLQPPSPTPPALTLPPTASFSLPSPPPLSCPPPPSPVQGLGRQVQQTEEEVCKLQHTTSALGSRADKTDIELTELKAELAMMHKALRQLSSILGNFGGGKMQRDGAEWGSVLRGGGDNSWGAGQVVSHRPASQAQPSPLTAPSAPPLPRLLQPLRWRSKPWAPTLRTSGRSRRWAGELVWRQWGGVGQQVQPQEAAAWSPHCHLMPPSLHCPATSLWQATQQAATSAGAACVPGGSAAP